MAHKGQVSWGAGIIRARYHKGLVSQRLGITKAGSIRARYRRYRKDWYNKGWVSLGVVS